MVKNIAIIGCSGAIGKAFTKWLSEKYPEASIYAFCRSGSNDKYGNVSYHKINYQDESSIEESAKLASKEMPLDRVFVTTGMLHNQNIMPEKSLKELSAEKFRCLFEVNTILPALIAKHFVPKLNKNEHSIFAALSARVGSISDNRAGGWYAYRSSKAALNMIIKNVAIETARTNSLALVVGLHPGTVDSPLSKPFQRNVEEGKLFTPEYSATKLLEVLEGLKQDSSGKCFAWDGLEVEP